MAPITVVVADDHDAVLLGVSMLFKLRDQAARGGSAPEFKVVGAARNGTEALAMVLDKRPDVACLDFTMPGGIDGFDLCRRLRGEVPGTSLVMYTGNSQMDLAERAMEMGVLGVVAKTDRGNEVVEAVRLAARGELFVSPAFAAQAEFKDLSPRQMEVLRHIAEGKDTGEIAELMGLGEATVRHHVKNLIAKLGAANRAQAVYLGMRNALLN